MISSNHNVASFQKELRGNLTRRKRGDIREGDVDWYNAYKAKLEAIDSRIQDLRNEKAGLGTGEKKEEDTLLLEGRIKILMDKFNLTREQALIMLGKTE